VLRGETGLLARVESPSPTMSDLSNANYTQYSRLVKLSAHEFPNGNDGGLTRIGCSAMLTNRNTEYQEICYV